MTHTLSLSPELQSFDKLNMCFLICSFSELLCYEFGFLKYFYSMEKK